MFHPGVPKLSVTVITRDEAANLAAALESVAWADEIVVVDSESTDATVEVARRYTRRVIVRPWPGYVAQKNHAAAEASHDWILSLDADERVSPGAGRRDPRRAASASPTPLATACRGSRSTSGRWIRTHRLVPRLPAPPLRPPPGPLDRAPRPRIGHGRRPVDDLRNELQHRAYRDLSHHLQTMDRYTTLAARQMREDGRRAGWIDLALHPPAAFLRNYVLRGGFRDGVPGLIISMLNATYVALKFAKLWELCSHSTSTPPSPGAADSTRSS